MDFPIFASQLYKIDYQNLFFLQNHSNIKTLMKLFKAKDPLQYYANTIRKYDVANMKLKNQIEKELGMVLKKLRKDNK